MISMTSRAVDAKAARGYDLLRFAPAAAGGLFLTYLVAVLVTNDANVLSAVKSSLCNVVPLVLLGLAVRTITRRYIMGRSMARQIGSHLALGAAFAVLWYWALMVLLAFTSGKSPLQFDVRPFFPAPAVAWQLHQGMIFYCLFVALTHLEATSRPGDSSRSAPSEAPTSDEVDVSPTRYFIRKGEDIHPIDVQQIVSITGAGDYTEVCTLNGQHLATMTLSDFEATLGNERFIRVHRSKIVNLEHVVRAEPAGAGRVLLHMKNGNAVRASRSGSKLFRERVI
jgi:two-component system, LytTR family, response regulator